MSLRKISRKNPLKEKETDIQKAICDYLALRQRCFWRSNNIPAFNHTGGSFVMRRLPKYTPRGLPDVNVIAGGIYFGLEVKSAIGRQSPDQKKMQELIEKHGGKYAIVRSVEEVIKLGL